jgi:hypothetical protein
VLAVFTIVLALSTILLWQETKRLAEGADDQSKKMVDAIGATTNVAYATEDAAGAMLQVAGAMANNATHTETLADAAAKSAATAERALKVLERPFVFAEVTEVKARESGLVSFAGSMRARPTFIFESVTLSFFNLGRTPASLRYIHYSYEAAQKDHGIASVIDPRRIRGRELPVGTIAAPDRPYSERENLILTFDDETKVAFAEGKKSLWVVGFVRYEDIFSQSHINGFCMVYDMVGEKFVRRGDEWYNYARIEQPHEIPTD